MPSKQKSASAAPEGPFYPDADVMTLSDQLAYHVADIDWAALPAPVQAAFRRTLVDYIACVSAGLDMAQVIAARDYATSAGGAPIATIIGSGMRVGVQDAAFTNGTATHSLDFDDGHREGSAHPGGVVISAALAVAEAQGSDWRAFSEAVVAGYEVMLRIAASMHPSSAMQGWHNSSVAGVFGSAAAAGRLLGLDVRQIAHAFGLAASFAGGIREYLYDGSDIKRLHLGKASRDGILCAEMARRGVSGARKVFEGENGLFRAIAAGSGDGARLVRGIGSHWEIATVYFKPYPCCRHFQAAIDGALKLRAENELDLNAITGIEIGLYGPGVPGHEHVAPTTLLDAQMSAPCSVVTTLVNGNPGVRDFAPEMFVSEKIQRLLSVARVVVDPLCDAEYPAIRTAVVRLTLSNGEVLECRVRNPRGEAENPLSDEELGQKFLENTGPVFGEDRAEALLSDIFADRFAGRSVGEFSARLLHGEQGHQK